MQQQVQLGAGGNGAYGGCYNASTGASIGGGVVIAFCKNINGSGQISADGVNGTSSASKYFTGGGGGGIALAFVNNQVENGPSITTNGGKGLSGAYNDVGLVGR